MAANINDAYQIVQQGMILGPLTFEELTRMQLEINTRVLSPKLGTWEDACDVPELDGYFEAKMVYFPAKSNLASFWQRLAAYVIDAVLIETTLLWVLYQLSKKGILNPQSPFQLFLALTALHIGVIIYNGICEVTEMRGSIGKKICGLIVVNLDGRKIRLLSALKRNTLKVLSRLVFYLGFLRVLWDENHQAWHDEFAKTYVLRRKSIIHGP